MTLALVQAPPVAKETTPIAHPSAAKLSAPPRRFRPTPAHADIDPLPAQAASAAQGVNGLSDGQLDGAATADSGAPGGACDMVRWLQSALRKDTLVQAAMASAGHGPGDAGKAILVWNGDWVMNAGQDGKGLAAVREAILWEVGFAPEACRKASVHGLVLISLSDAPGVARLALGAGDWRWADLLTPRGLDSSARQPGG